MLDRDIRDAVLKLEKLEEETRQQFVREHNYKTWFRE